MFRAAALIVIVLCITSAASTETSKNSSDGDRIVGGRTAGPNEFPYQASIQSAGFHLCGGCIINSRTILTAGHCIKKFKDDKYPYMTVRVGSIDWMTGGQVKKIISMILHPNYNPRTKEYDFGLLKLGSPIEIDSAASPIALADNVPTDGKIGIISGFGLTKEDGLDFPTLLQTVEVTSLSRKNCSQPPWDYGDRIKPSMICAYGKGKDACQGDSGGPYVSKASGKLWGIISWGDGCGQEEYPGVLAAIAGVKKWIEKIAATFV